MCTCAKKYYKMRQNDNLRQKLTFLSKSLYNMRKMLMDKWYIGIFFLFLPFKMVLDIYSVHLLGLKVAPGSYMIDLS